MRLGNYAAVHRLPCKPLCRETVITVLREPCVNVASFWKIKKILALPRNSRMELRVSRQTMEAWHDLPGPRHPTPTTST